MSESIEKSISDDGYRTRFFDDLVVGERFHSNWRHLTTDEILRFSDEFDRQFFHVDAEAAEASRFGGLIASGAHTFAFWNKINLDVNGDICWIAGLGFEEFRFPNALRPNVEFRATSELASARVSASDATRGIAVHRYELRARDDDACLFTALCTALVERNPA